MTPFTGQARLTLGEIIMIERKRRGLSQAQLAEMCHISRALVSLIEDGCTEVRISVLQAIAEAMGFMLVVDMRLKENRIECGRKDSDDEHEK